MAARAKLQDEQNLKSLRELVALPLNKYCFDCRQRGPTYVNVTIGSFVCTSCGGILRGLNPPHRVKSITMAKFTSDEIQFVKNRGNEYCRHVWLGKYDSRPGMEPDSQNAQKTRDFIIQKYEGKKWYIDPEIAIHQMSQQSVSSNIAQEVKVQNATTPSFNLEPKVSSWTPAIPPADDNRNLPADVFTGFNSDPFASPKQSGNNSGGDAFADFSSAFGNTSSSNASNQDNVSSAAFTFSSSIPAFDVSSSSMDTSLSTSDLVLSTNKKQAAPPPPDRYAALADLDLELNQTQIVTTSSTSLWSGSNSSAFGGPPVISSYTTGTSESSNPFGTTPTWSQTNAIPSANPFQASSQPPPAVLQNFSQFPKPAAFPPANPMPNGGDAYGMQNGITSSPWGGSINMWDTGLKNGQGLDTFQAPQLNQRLEPFNPWSQTQPTGMSGANPFMHGSGAAVGIPANVPRLNPGNPFL